MRRKSLRRTSSLSSGALLPSEASLLPSSAGNPLLPSLPIFNSGAWENSFWGGPLVDFALCLLMRGAANSRKIVPRRYLLKIMTDRQVFMLMSLLPLSLVGLAAFLPDKKVTEGKAGDHNLRAKAQQLYKTVMMPEIFYPTAFIFILNATPSTGSAWFFFYSSKPPLGLGFTPEFLGTINVVGSVFNLGGQKKNSSAPRFSSIQSPFDFFWQTSAH